MGYIEKLRQSIGHDTIIMVGATVLYMNEKNEILMQLRADTHDWSLPGGSMEIGEKVEEAAARELYEETGLRAEGMELIHVFSGPEYFYIYPNQDQTDTVIVLYRAQGVRGTPQIHDGESLALRFFHYSQLPSPLEARTAHMFRELFQMGYFEKRL